MNDLIDWYLKRLAEAEQQARAADEGPWKVGSTSGAVWPDGDWAYGSDEIRIKDGEVWPQPHTVRGSHVSGQRCQIVTLEDCGRAHREANAVHIAAHDPAWRLRDIELKRQIVTECVADLEQRGNGALQGAVDRPTWAILCHLAAEFEGAVGWREEWRAD